MSPRPTRRKFLWITDPWETLDHVRDTTLRLAREAAHLGFESHWCDVRTIRLEGSQVLLESSVIREGDSATEPDSRQTKSPSNFSSIHYRVDPPVDLAYLHPLQLLCVNSSASSRIVNPPKILFGHNEKLEAVFLEDLMPETLVSGRWEDLERFGKNQQKTVVKPLHEAQSKGVQLLSWSSRPDFEKNRQILSEMTDSFRRPILLQRYLAGISEGELRLWFVDGDLLAYVRKMPLKNDFRVNIDLGSSLKKTTLTSLERKKSARIGKLLRKQGIRLAAVDLIEGFVTDFNFTSPGLVTQMEKTLGENLALPIIRALAKNS